MTPQDNAPERLTPAERAEKILKALHKEYGFYVEDLLSGKSKDIIIAAQIEEAVNEALCQAHDAGCRKCKRAFAKVCMECHEGEVKAAWRKEAGK